MKEKELVTVAINLGKALDALSVAGIEDEKLWSRYAEYLIAFMLTKEGQVVQVLNERIAKGQGVLTYIFRKKTSELK